MSESLTPLRAAIIAEAEKFLGITEPLGENDGLAPELFTFGEKKPYCAAFVAEVFRRVNAPLPGNKWLLPSVEYMEETMREAGRWIVPGFRGRLALPGDIVFYRWREGSDPGGGRHCGILTETIQSSQVRTIEANVGNTIKRMLRMFGPSVTGFGVAEGTG